MLDVLRLLSKQDIAIALVLVAFVAFIIVQKLSKLNPLKKLPSPKPSSVIFGHVFDLYVSVIKWKTTLTYPEPFITWVKTYGGAIYIQEFINDKVLLSDPLALQHVMVTNAKNYPHEPVVENFFADITLGRGLLSTNDTAHDRFRKILNPIFTWQQVKSFVELFHTHALECCETDLSQASAIDAPIDLGAVLKQLVLKIIGLAAFNYDFNQYPATVEAYYDFMMELNPLLFIGTFFIPGFLHFPLPSAKQLKDIFAKTIKERLTTPNNSRDGKTKDLLDLMLPHSTTEEAITHTMSFMVGGHEAPTAVMGYAFAYLSTQPESVDRIRQEYSEAIQRDPAIASGEALSALRYTLAVVNEVLRLHPPVYELADRYPREEDTKVPMSDGSFVHLPKGTKVQISVAAMHRNPKYWSNPDAFVPNRFMEDTKEWNVDLQLRGGKNHAFIFMPFGAGSKQCIGYRFALAKMQVIVATLLSKFDFKLTDQADLRPVFNFLLLQPVNLEVLVSPVRPAVKKTDNSWEAPARNN
ncbi:unnamed protein product [Aphanomyces euteiches]